MANKYPYSRLLKGMRYPKGLKDWIIENTDYSYRVTNVSRYVHYIQMFEGKPLRRVFAYRSESKVFMIKKRMKWMTKLNQKLWSKIQEYDLMT